MHAECDSAGADRLPQATALLSYFPQPNLTPQHGGLNNYNYHLLTTAQSNSTQAGVRYMRSLGKNATHAWRRAWRHGRRTQIKGQNQGLRQSINFNYNWTHSASDAVNFVPQLGGKSASDSNSVQAGLYSGLSQGDQHLQM